MSQKVLSVDLQELGSAFETFCQRHGLVRKERAAFVRSALKAAIGNDGELTSRAFVVTSGDSERKWLRTSVPRKTYNRLVEAMRASGTRSLSQYLQAVAERADVVPMAASTKSRDGVSPETMKALTASTSALLALGRNINQISKSLHMYPGKTTEKDRDHLRSLPERITKHTEAAAKLLLELKPPRARRRGKRDE